MFLLSNRLHGISKVVARLLSPWSDYWRIRSLNELLSGMVSLLRLIASLLTSATRSQIGALPHGRIFQRKEPRMVWRIQPSNFAHVLVMCFSSFNAFHTNRHGTP